MNVGVFRRDNPLIIGIKIYSRLTAARERLSLASRLHEQDII